MVAEATRQLIPEHGANVLLTGVTGFVGRYLLYQLCEADFINEIFVLIRPKHGQDPEDRFKEVLNDELFDAARKQGVEFDNITVITGDVKQPKLGMSEDDIEMLSDKLDMVVHNAATLSFACTLQQGMRSNTTCSWELYNMCKDEFERHPAFIMISTIATNSHLDIVPEEITPFSAPAEMVYNYIKHIPREREAEQFEFLKEGRLDGYGFSKGLLERMIYEDVEASGGAVPVYFVRPGGIISAARGPLPGWIHNTCFYGQLAYFIYQGKLPCFLADKNLDLNMAPVDYVGNLTMCCALEALEKREAEDFSVQVVNGSKILLHGINFDALFDAAAENWKKLEMTVPKLAPEGEYHWAPLKQPFYFQSIWIFELLYTIFVHWPLALYCMWLGEDSPTAKKYTKLVNYIYKYVLVLTPYLTKPISLENKYCEKLEQKYGHKYDLDADLVDRPRFLYNFLEGVGVHIVPFMQKQTKKIMKKK